MKKSVSIQLWVILVTVLASCASTRPVPPLEITGALIPVAAEYVTTRTGHDGEKDTEVHWRFFRTENRIDIDNMQAHTGEVWLRDGKTIQMRQLFHDDRKGVEYLMDDFSVLGMKPSWDREALLVDPHTLQQLPETGAYWLAGQPVRRYQGEVNGQQLEIIWRVDSNVPQSITRLHGAEKEATRLLAVYPLAQSPWQYNNGDNYELIDYTDLGDRERDPFVLKIQSQLPGGDVHHH